MPITTRSAIDNRTSLPNEPDTGGETVRVGYVVSRFPKTTETFIAREALAVADLGHEVTMMTITRENGQIVQPGVERLLPDLVAGNDAGVGELLRAQVRWLRRHPRRLGRMWWRAVAGNVRSIKFLVRALVISAMAPWVADRAKARELDHLHAHWGSHSALLAHQVALLTGLPYSVTLHAHDLHINRTMLGEKLAAAARVVTISDHNRELLADLYPALGPVEVVHCGVDVGSIAPRAAEPDNHPPRLVMVAGLRNFKGHVHLFEALRILELRDRKVALDVVGDGPLRAELEETAGDNVVFHGAVDIEKVLRIVAGSDVAVMPSVVMPDGRRDGIPVALIEAMALGVPVISTRVSGIPELVEHEITGLLVEQRNPEQLADAVERLLDDDELRRHLGESGRHRVEHEFDLLVSVRQMVDCFLPDAG
ncbi:MAG: glycosyltransferase family 4 protein [Acidimicrobiia bacterium]|nr:glycosyltransferase family 4 protein [Acidimicrobiia bacterium]